MGGARKLALGGVVAGASGALWWRANPTAFPYSQRVLLEVTHPFLTHRRLVNILAPSPGERLLEVGPGTGYYALPVAERLRHGGQLDIFDLQQEMLDHTMRRAREESIDNITPSRGDARELPYPEASFDGAYLVTVLGEVPDQEAALRELRRVVKPGGRIVIGEVVLDPHIVTRSALRRRAGAAGLRVDQGMGNAFWHYTRLARD